MDVTPPRMRQMDAYFEARPRGSSLPARRLLWIGATSRPVLLHNGGAGACLISGCPGRFAVMRVGRWRYGQKTLHFCETVLPDENSVSGSLVWGNQDGGGRHPLHPSSPQDGVRKTTLHSIGPMLKLASHSATASGVRRDGTFTASLDTICNGRAHVAAPDS